jgi:multidrug efflux pump subunit AcrA (membrane-fusion protein)
VFGKERVSERIVTIGKSHGDFVEVTSGVAPGEQVITTLDRRLTDGLLVQN